MTMGEAQNQSSPPSGEPNQGEPEKRGRSFWKRLPVMVTGTLLLAVLLFMALGVLVESLTHESTDNAFLDGDIVAIAPKVSGHVKRVPVIDNQTVKAGELLLEVD